MARDRKLDRIYRLADRLMREGNHDLLGLILDKTSVRDPDYGMGWLSATLPVNRHPDVMAFRFSLYFRTKKRLIGLKEDWMLEMRGLW